MIFQGVKRKKPIQRNIENGNIRSRGEDDRRGGARRRWEDPPASSTEASSTRWSWETYAFSPSPPIQNPRSQTSCFDFHISRRDASLMWAPTPITRASSPEPLACVRKTRFFFSFLFFGVYGSFFLSLWDRDRCSDFVWMEFLQVHLIRMSTSGTELVCEGLFYHPSEIWDLKSCPFDPRIFSTVFSSGRLFTV